jgi:hypothetical protein
LIIEIYNIICLYIYMYLYIYIFVYIYDYMCIIYIYIIIYMALNTHIDHHWSVYFEGAAGDFIISKRCSNPNKILRESEPVLQRAQKHVGFLRREEDWRSATQFLSFGRDISWLIQRFCMILMTCLGMPKTTTSHLNCQRIVCSVICNPENGNIWVILDHHLKIFQI